MTVSACRRTGGRRRGPGVRAGSISAAIVKEAAAASTPNDHLVTGPDSGVMGPRRRCVCRAGRTPAVPARIIFPTGLDIDERESVVIHRAAPNNHLSAGPNCGVIKSRSGNVRVADRCPTVR